MCSRMVNSSCPTRPSSNYTFSLPLFTCSNILKVLMILISYHALSEIDSPGKPHACSSPIAHQAKKGSSEIKVKNRIQRPLKIVNINFQSIKNKKPELDILLDTQNLML